MNGVRRGPRRSRAEADQIANEYEASGLTRQEFCRGRGIAIKRLARYVARHRQNRSGAGEPVRLVPVEVAGAAGGGSELVVVVGHERRIEVRRGFDAGTLRQLIMVLEKA